MSLQLKDPDAVITYSIDWGAHYLGDLTLALSEWDVEPVEPGGIAIEGVATANGRTTVTLSGGLAGHAYRIANRIALSDGSADTRSIHLRVEAR
jgi:hypothetical protein